MVLTEPKWYQYVSVSLEGKGKVHWSETYTTGTGDNRRTHTRHYSANETFADLTVIVWGNQEAPQPVRVDPGTFNFPFQFTIPPNCPPTFDTHHGNIKYQLIGIIASQTNQYKIKSPLIISGLVDLNRQPNLLQPINETKTNQITTCCCINSGEAEITFKMPRTGFCIVQERLPVTFECRNGSSRQISVTVQVLQSIVYNARGHTKSTNDTVGNFACQIPASGSDTKSVEFDLPSSIKLGFTSQIINVVHSVRLLINHSLDIQIGFLQGPAFAIPIVIGNVPLHNAQIPSQVSTQTFGMPSTQAGPLPVQSQGFPPQGSAPPPVGFVTPADMPQHSGVPSTPPTAELQSQAPPSYREVTSGAKF